MSTRRSTPYPWLPATVLAQTQASIGREKEKTGQPTPNSSPARSLAQVRGLIAHRHHTGQYITCRVVGEIRRLHRELFVRSHAMRNTRHSHVTAHRCSNPSRTLARLMRANTVAIAVNASRYSDRSERALSTPCGDRQSVRSSAMRLFAMYGLPLAALAHKAPRLNVLAQVVRLVGLIKRL